MAELLVVEVDPAARPSSAAVAPSPIAPPVDLDNVPKLYHLQSVQAPAKAPFPVSVVGSARTGQKALPSQGQLSFHARLENNVWSLRFDCLPQLRTPGISLLV